jgi:glycerol-3-phosphate acyltransferase PlsY
MTQAIAVVLAYLLGSIPFAYLAGRAKGVDIRTVGSRNVGATNVFRTLGRRIGVAVMLLDIGKGVAATLIARALTDAPWPLVAGAAAILGHVFPVWLRFKGGKGVAVGGGAVIGLVPLVSLIVLGVWFVVVAATRYVSLASIAAAVAFPVGALALGEPWPTLVFSLFASGAVIVRHRANVGRLVRRQEPRIELGRRRGDGDAAARR